MGEIGHHVTVAVDTIRVGQRFWFLVSDFGFLVSSFGFMRTTTLQKYAVVPRRARIQGSQTLCITQLKA